MNEGDCWPCKFGLSTTSSEARNHQCDIRLIVLEVVILRHCGGGAEEPALSHPDHKHCRYILPDLPHAVLLQPVLAYRSTRYDYLRCPPAMYGTCSIPISHASPVNRRPRKKSSVGINIVMIAYLVDYIFQRPTIPIVQSHLDVHPLPS